MIKYEKYSHDEINATGRLAMQEQCRIAGWLFDSYYSTYEKSLVFWIKKDDDNSSSIQIKNSKWKNYFYVVSSDNQKFNLQKISDNKEIMSFVYSYDYVSRQEKITDSKRKKTKVLRLYLSSPHSIIKLAKIIERLASFQEIRLYNIDLLPEQRYFFDYDIFPLGLYDKTGTFTYVYLARATIQGSFVALPAEVYAMYDPEFWGSSSSGTISITSP